MEIALPKLGPVLMKIITKQQQKIICMQEKVHCLQRIVTTGNLETYENV